ncbi:MAG: DNA primase [Propionicimonas sp.]|uniref:DNA primase n=1 Tax=Propionicimonas sp. TaxID=1955623 RepID=UPI002B1F4F8E|nr:DNA primase [Propionicimonas sp.]MEA4942925.1 DNA primase [Propionicimonas sp.]
MAVAGLINEEDLTTVRERSRIDEVVGAYVTLRPAGGGSLTGLCPFHEEKTPSFRVTPARGFFHCFGCGEGGDVISFVQKIQNVTFVEAVEWLADRAGVQLRYAEGGPNRPEPGLRLRILEANRIAAEFFAEQLRAPEGLPGRQFLAGRGFDEDAATHFGIGFAPRGGKSLGSHLKAKGFSDAELVRAGLVRDSGWDFFQGRVLWPIRDAGRSVLGFGARRLFDDDRMPAKYLNTPETPVYKKSSVLYGLDLARGSIAKKGQAVVVEGYTDVMAAHLAGVDTAVASCGTAFGDDHARMLARLIDTQGVQSGEVIFTFDGDAAGQAAALKVFKGDQHFSSQTYVAVEPTGLDPCDLRIQHGDAAVRELVARRVPLYQFVMRNTIAGFDLDRVEGRVAALRAAAPLVSSIRDASLVSGYVRELAGMLGMNPDEVRAEVKRVHAGARPSRPVEPRPEPVAPTALPIPDPRDRGLEAERGTLRLLLRAPEIFTATLNDLVADDFAHPAYRALFERIGAVTDRTGDWAQQLAGELDPVLAQLVVTLAVEPVLREPTAGYAAEYAAGVRLQATARRIAALKSRLQRTNPVDDPAAHQKMFQTLIELESRRKQLLGLATGPAL